MTLTRAQLRTMALNWADASTSTRWDTTAGGEVDQLAGYVQLQIWKRVLNAYPAFLTATRTVTTSAPNPASIWPYGGTFDTSTLSSGTGDTQQNLYRIIVVSFNNLQYTEERPKNYLVPYVAGSTSLLWFAMGSTIVVPGTASSTGTVWVSWTPTPVHQLATDSSTVVLPSTSRDAAVPGDDCNQAIAALTAALMLNKGGAESDAADRLQAQGAAMLEELLQDLSRLSTGALMMQYDDSPYNWGVL